MIFDRETAWRAGIAFAVFAVALLSIMMAWAHARDRGQWQGGDVAVREWFQSLMQPDNPGVSCCGEADAYWADQVEVKDGKVYAIITDDRADEPLGRPHVPLGTRIEVPNRKLKWDRGNPSGHTIIFLSSGLVVYCYVQASGA